MNLPDRNEQNYRPVYSKAGTYLTYLVRRADRIEIKIGTWLTKTGFRKRRPVYRPLSGEVEIAGAIFTAVMAANNNYAANLFANLDARLTEIFELNRLGRVIGDYEIDVLNNLVMVQSTAGGIIKPLMTMLPDEFDEVMQNADYADDIENALGFCFGYVGEQSSELGEWVKALINGEE